MSANEQVVVTTSTQHFSFSLSLDCCLCYHNIPVELRRIVQRYSHVSIDNNTVILHAVREWQKFPTITCLMYGPISYWDTSKVTDMGYLFGGCS